MQIANNMTAFNSNGRLSYADCFTASLGKLRQAEVITGDPEFNKLAGEITITWKTKME